VVSDNVGLVKFFMDEVFSESCSVDCSVAYAYSIKNKEPSALCELGMVPIDLKSEKVIDETLQNYDIVFSAHCKQIFPSRLVEGVRCVNVHPGYNPYNRGWYPQVFSIINKLPVGATIHEMDADIDHGAIIDQGEVVVCSYDTSYDVYEKVISLEKRLVLKNIDKILLNNYIRVFPKSEGNYNSVSDFKEMCQLDINHVGTLREHLDVLRALTFNGYKNAYYADGDGTVYVSITLEYKRNDGYE